MLQNIAAALAPSLLAGGLLLIPLVGCSESSSVPMADGGIQTDAARDSEVRAANGDWAIWCPNGEINCVPSGPIRIDAGDDVQVMCSGTRSFVGYEFDASVSVEIDGVRSGFSASNVVVPLNGVLATSGSMAFQHGGVDYGAAELGSCPDRCLGAALAGGCSLKRYTAPRPLVSAMTSCTRSSISFPRSPVSPDSWRNSPAA